MNDIRHLKIRCARDLADRLDVMATGLVLGRSKLIELLLRQALDQLMPPHECAMCGDSPCHWIAEYENARGSAAEPAGAHDPIATERGHDDLRTGKET